MGEQFEAKELSRRRTDGLEVVLWWVKGTISTYVEVTDHKTGADTFYITTPDGVSPNEVFNHPFAWAVNDIEEAA